MSIRHGLLALLERGPMYGYQLRASFEESTGATWPLNIGQVYTTLSRLERDGMVRPLPETDGGQRTYEITELGRTELTLWFATPVSRADRPRDELAIKLALALTTPGVDVPAVVQSQRTATMRTLQEYTRLKVRGQRPDDMSWRLVLDAMVFQAEAEIRWLDHCEVSLVRWRPAGAGPSVRPGSAGRTGSPDRSGSAERSSDHRGADDRNPSVNRVTSADRNTTRGRGGAAARESTAMLGAGLLTRSNPPIERRPG